MELALGRTDQQLADDARRTLGTQGELGASRTTAERRKRKEVLLPNALKPNATEQQKQKEEREGSAALHSNSNSDWNRQCSRLWQKT